MYSSEEKPVSRGERHGGWEEGEEGSCLMLDALSPPAAGSGLQETPGLRIPLPHGHIGRRVCSWPSGVPGGSLCQQPGHPAHQSLLLFPPTRYGPIPAHAYTYILCPPRSPPPSLRPSASQKSSLTPAPTQRLSALNSRHPRFGPHCSQICFLRYSRLTVCEHTADFLKLCLRLFLLAVTW